MPSVSTPITLQETRRVVVSESASAFDFNAQIINPDAKIATMELELWKDGVKVMTQVQSVSGDEFAQYFEQDPDTAPLVVQAVRATRAAWIAILQKKGVLPAGAIVDNWPNP